MPDDFFTGFLPSYLWAMIGAYAVGLFIGFGMGFHHARKKYFKEILRKMIDAYPGGRRY